MTMTLLRRLADRAESAVDRLDDVRARDNWACQLIGTVSILACLVAVITIGVGMPGRLVGWLVG